MPNEEEDALRSAFVEMLFALAVAEVAIHTYEAFAADGSWHQKAPAVAHLALGLLVLAASWVGWRQSVSPGMKDRVQTIFSRSFIGLLLDVLIVICYFILVKNVEVRAKNDEPTLLPPSGRPEAIWVCVIFAVYAVWDLVADVLSPECIPVGSLGVRVSLAVRAAIVSTAASLVSFSMAFYVFYVWTEAADTDAEVVAVDAALAAVVVLFRLFKYCEKWLSAGLKVSHLKAFSRPRPMLPRDRWAFWGAGLLYAGAICYLARG